MAIGQNISNTVGGVTTTFASANSEKSSDKITGLIRPHRKPFAVVLPLVFVSVAHDALALFIDPRC